MKQTRDEKILRIQNAMTSLAKTRKINNISIYDIASEAHMSASTIYHYYPNVEALLYVMMTKVFEDFVDVVKDCLNGHEIVHWKDVNRLLEQSLTNYCDANPIAKKLLYCQHPFVSIKEAARENDKILGEEIEKQYRRYFKLPDLPANINIFIIALEAADSLYFSQNKEGEPVSDEIIKEAQILTERYLSYYLPDYLPRI